MKFKAVKTVRRFKPSKPRMIKMVAPRYTFRGNFPYQPEMLDYEIVDTVESLKELSRKMRDVKAFAFDTETNSLEARSDDDSFKCVCVTISWGEYDNYYIPLNHDRDEDIDRNIPLPYFLRYMKPIFENLDVLLIGHNLKFDEHVLTRLGIRFVTNNYFDTMLASWLCDENSPNGLKENAQERMGISAEHFKEVVNTVPSAIKKAFGLKANAKATYNLVLIDDGAPYALADSFNTFMLYLGYVKELEDLGLTSIYNKMYIPFLKVLYEMEERGVVVNRDKLESMGESMQKDMDDLKYKIYALSGIEFNIGSSQQKAEILFGYRKPDKLFKDMKEGSKSQIKFIENYKKKNGGRYPKPNEVVTKSSPNENIIAKSFGFKINAYTDSGAPATDSDAIWRISRLTYVNKRKKDGVKMCEYLLQYAKLEKLKTAFVDGILDKIDRTEKVHPSFNQIGTDSGRLSCIAEDTPVMTVGDSKPIQDVKVGDLVYCYDDKGELQVRKVLNVIDRGIKECVSVNWRSQGTHDRHSLICTPDHKIFNHKLEWVRADHLSKGDKVVHLRRSSYERPRLYGYSGFCEQEQVTIKKKVFGVSDPNAISRKLNIGRFKVNKTIDRLGLCYNHNIESVTPCGKRHVYDIEVEEFHNFIAGEICVHNCSSPNLQQLPKAGEEDKYQIRDVFIGSLYVKSLETGKCYDNEEKLREEEPDSDFEVKRKKILTLDYHNLEMVCLTYFSKDKNLSTMFANDDDAHGSTAVNMFNLDCTPVECKKKYPHLRQAAKTINFLLMYGGGARLLYENLKADHSNPLDLGEEKYLKEYKCRDGVEVAQKFIDKYFESYSGVAKFISNQKRYAHKHKYVYTILGRKRRLPNINSSDGAERSYSERLSVNSAVQGTAADITVNAQLRISREERLKEILCYMLIQIHDEICLEVPEEHLEEAIKIIKYDMEHPFGDSESRRVPYLRADEGFGDSYQEAK